VSFARDSGLLHERGAKTTGIFRHRGQFGPDRRSRHRIGIATTVRVKEHMRKCDLLRGHMLSFVFLKERFRLLNCRWGQLPDAKPIEMAKASLKAARKWLPEPA
jgi:hypothetical protein